MLTPEQFETIERQASGLYTNLELEIIQEIAERIANVGYANTVALNSANIAQEMGYTYEKVIALVAKYNNQTEEEIQRIFEEAGAQTLKFDDRIYKETGLNPVPIKKSKSIMRLMEATIAKTNMNLSNLVMTTANTSQTQFYNAMNKAYMEVSTGLKSYSQAIVDTIKEISNQGAYVEYSSGRKMNIESAVRMNITTGVNQTCGKLQMLRAQELDWDLMELTAHSGARPSHAEWQGKIVSLSGRSGYLSLDDIGYGEVTGFKGVNCNHDWMPFYEGSTRTYTDNELEKLATETVTYNGEKISRYDAQQLQRKMERQIRQDKRDIAGLQGILTSATKDDELLEKTKANFANMQIKSRQHNIELNDFLRQTSLRKDYSRLKIGVTKDVKDDIILTEKEQYAINKYISSDFYKINEKLRSGKRLNSEEKELVTNLDSMLGKMPKYKGLVTRSLELDNEQLQKFLDVHKLGEKIEYKAYTSTTCGERYNEISNVELYIDAKNGRDIRKYNKEEQEILFKRNSLFKVKQIEKIKGTYHILLEEANG